VDELLNAAPAWDTQIALLSFSAAFWWLVIGVFNIGEKIGRPIYLNHPMSEQWIQLNRKYFKDGFGIDFDREQALTFALTMQGILLQHIIGGLLCLPVLVGWGSPALGYTLGRWGALCEAGWELQDGLVRIVQVNCGGEKGKELNPVPLRILMTVHHVMGLSLVVPMNIYFSENYWYIYLVCLLQLAAAVAMLGQNYGFLLDVTTPSGLCKMKVATFFVWAVMFYSRGPGYLYVIYKVLCLFYNTGDAWFCWGCFVAWAMSLLNIVFIMDATQKMTKFAKMKLDDASMSPSKRRNSIAMIEEATGGETRELKIARRASVIMGMGMEGGTLAREQENLKEPFLQVA